MSDEIKPFDINEALERQKNSLDNDGKNPVVKMPPRYSDFNGDTIQEVIDQYMTALREYFKNLD